MYWRMLDAPSNRFTQAVKRAPVQRFRHTVAALIAEQRSQIVHREHRGRMLRATDGKEIPKLFKSTFSKLDIRVLYFSLLCLISTF